MNTSQSIQIKFGDLFNNGKLRTDQWIEWRHEKETSNCCEIGKALDKCWFRDDIRPPQPLYSYCHCTKKAIKNPVPNKTATAVCDLTKFTEFVWGEKHRWRGKWKFYEEMGYTVADSVDLAKELEQQAVQRYCNGEYTLDRLDESGQRINIYIVLKGNKEKRRFGTGWMVRPYGKITNMTPLGRNEKDERI